MAQNVPEREVGFAAGFPRGPETVIIRDMQKLRVESVAEPFAGDPELMSVAIDMLTLMESMGLLADEADISRLDAGSVDILARAAGRAGLAPQAVAELATAGARGRRRAIVQLRDALRESPLPEHEWGAMTSTLGVEPLAQLLGVAEASLRRYASGARATPDEVAGRLHHLAQVVGYLRGGYNDIGIRRWFRRSRQALGGDAPAAFLGGGWSPDDDRAQAVLELARALTSSPAT